MTLQGPFWQFVFFFLLFFCLFVSFLFVTWQHYGKKLKFLFFFVQSYHKYRSTTRGVELQSSVGHVSVYMCVCACLSSCWKMAQQFLLLEGPGGSAGQLPSSASKLGGFYAYPGWYQAGMWCETTHLALMLPKKYLSGQFPNIFMVSVVSFKSA